MISFLDIARTDEVVHGIKVRGLSLESIVMLLLEFPALSLALQGGGITGPDIIRMAPAAIGDIVCHACGLQGQDGQAAAFSNLPLETQLDFIEAVIRQTMPGGFGPFVARLEKQGIFAAVSQMQPDAS